MPTLRRVSARVTVRSDTAANWTSEDPVLLNGEIGWESDSTKLKVGDGATAWSSLGYYHTGEDAPGALVHDNTRWSPSVNSYKLALEANYDSLVAKAPTDSPTFTTNIELEGSSGDLIFEMDNNAANSANFQIQNGAGNARADLVLDSNTHITLKGQRVGVLDTTPGYTLDVNGDGRFVTDLTVGGDVDVIGDYKINGSTIAVFPGFGTSAGTALEGDTALLALGTSGSTALAGDTTTISSGQASAITANTAKVTNATHTGEVTGATALTIADDTVDEANLKVDNSPTDDYVLTAKSSAAGGLTWVAAAAGGGGGGQAFAFFVS